MPTDGDSAAVSSQDLYGSQSWELMLFHKCSPHRAHSRGEANLHPLIQGTEMSSIPRAEGGAGQPLDGHTFAWTAPPLAEGGEKRRPGQPSPTVGSGAVCTMTWTPLLLVLLSHCTGRDRPQGPRLSSQVSSPLAPSPEKLPLFLPNH